MKRGQIVSRKTTTSHTGHSLGAVVATEERSGWRFLQVQWVLDNDPLVPIDERSEWLRHDEVTLLEPFRELKRIQDAMTLSSALLSKNFEKILVNERLSE